MTDRLQVRHPELVTHARTVETAGDQVTAAREAGQAVRAGPDSYGRWCGLLPTALGVLQDVLVAAIGDAATALDETGARLRATAEGYEAADQRRADAFRAVPGKR